MKYKKLLIFILFSGLCTVKIAQPSEKELVDILHGLAGEQQQDGRGVDPALGQIGAWERIGDIIQGYNAPVSWKSFEGESKIVDKDTYDTIALSPNRRFLAAGLYAGDKIHLWDLSQSYEKSTIIDGNIVKLSFSPDSHYMTTQLKNGNTISIWNLQDLQAPPQIVSPDNPKVKPAQIRFSPDSRYVIHSFHLDLNNQQFTVWDLQNLGKSPEVFPFFGYSPKGRYKMVRGPKVGDSIQILDLENPGNKPFALDLNIEYAYFSPDERMLIGGSKDRRQLWDIEDLLSGPKDIDKKFFLTFSRTGRYITLDDAEFGKERNLWETQSLYAGKKPLETTSDIATFSSDDAYIVLWPLSDDKKSKVLNMANPAKSFTIDENMVNPRFSPNNNYLVGGTDLSPSDSNKITIWDIQNAGKKLTTLDGAIKNTYFSPDSRYIITLHNGIVVTDLSKIQQPSKSNDPAIGVPEQKPQEEVSGEQPETPQPPVSPPVAAVSNEDLMQSLINLAEALTAVETTLGE